VKLLTMKKNVQ